MKIDPVRNKKIKISADLQKANRISNGVDIEKLAILARIKLTSKEKEKLQKEFGVILDYISQLKEIDISKIDDMEAGKTVDLENIMREDENPHKTAQFSEELLKEAPSTDKGYVKVKHILE